MRDPRDTTPVEEPITDWRLTDQTKTTGRRNIARIRHEHFGGRIPPPELTIETETL